jgi:hypothetical protein
MPAARTARALFAVRLGPFVAVEGAKTSRVALFDTYYGAQPGLAPLCYTAEMAAKRIEQNGCGSAQPKDKGTKITPKPEIPVTTAATAGATPTEPAAATADIPAASGSHPSRASWR